MYKKLNAGGVESDKGFTVQTLTRNLAEYKEGKNKVTIYYDLGEENQHFFQIIERNSFLKWDNGIAIPPEKQEEIINNYIDAVNFKGLKVKVYSE